MPAIIAVIVALGIVAACVIFVVPAVTGLLTQDASTQTVEAGTEVSVNIPEGSGGDAIASILSQAHVIEDPKDYYAAVKKLGAESSLKPGDYTFTTGQDPLEVVQALVAGPAQSGSKLTLPEGITLEQTAARVQDALGISSDEFIAQAKASNYVADYPILEGAYNDSLEGFLYPKTYVFQEGVTADAVIRTLLDQFVKETNGLNLEAGANGLTAHQLISMASLIERETAVDDERATIASVIYNRLEANIPLQIDAAIVYARGGGNEHVSTGEDGTNIDSPYNVYKNTGLTPGPICSPSIASIKAALEPASTDYLYYVASTANDGSHTFSSDYNQFLKDKQAYSNSRSQ